MIYIFLQGGLGNMLFQTAAAMSIAKTNDTQISISNLTNHLNYLNKETVFNPSINYCSEYKNLNMFCDVKQETPPLNTETINFPFHFESFNFKEKEKIIQGFFQSEKYFKPHKKLILNKFEPTNEILNLINKKYPNLIKQKNTTSIHVRRQDYLKLPNHHPTCTIKYYQEAVKKIHPSTEHYYIFSDDIEWCKKTFIDKKNCTFMENNKDYIDLYLMSFCSNNIISNSTLSWWSAWINPNPNKIVISPHHSKWLGVAYKQWNTSDIIPPEWIQL